MYKEVFLLFSKKKGCQFIAQQYALKGIEKIAKKNSVHSVFEFGIGIGTIPYLLNSLNKKIDYYGIEGNEFCIDAFRKNLDTINSKFSFNHILNYSEYTSSFKFDFIIIDGLFDNENFLKKIVKLDTIILVEGDREPQRKMLSKVFPQALISKHISLCRNLKNSPFYLEENRNFIGGYTIFRLNPSIQNKVKWFLEKVLTFFKYRIREYL